MTTALIIDTETTGLLLPRTAELSSQPRIIELAIIRVENNKIVSEHEWLIDPEVPLPAIITKITGIRDEQLVGKRKFRELLVDIEEAFAGADILVAHNLKFDKGMLETELERCARTGFPWPKTEMCTVVEHHHLKGRRLKLLELYEITFGRKLAQTHRALDDTRALAEICIDRGIL